MRILFAGSPAIAVPTLERLVQDGVHEVVGVLTNPDTPKGRRGMALPTDVGAAAERLSLRRVESGLSAIPIFKPDRLGPEARALVSEVAPDLLISVAYGRIFGPKFLGLFPAGGINLHPSLLPKYRGATPIPAAILNRDVETGISVQFLALDMDAGDILAQERIPLDFTETTESLSAFVATRGAGMVANVVEALENGMAKALPQEHGEATYCAMIDKEDGLIDWFRSAKDLDARIRAFTPWPLSFTTHRGKRLYVLGARPQESASARGEPGTVVGIDKGSGILVQTGDGLLAIDRLQYDAKKALDWRSFLNGAREFVGSRLGVDDSSSPKEPAS